MELTVTRWDVRLFLSEHGGRTHAEARLSILREHLVRTDQVRTAQ